jgi:hypothetical protein
MSTEPKTIEVRYKTFTELLNFGEEKNIGDIAKVRWNADGFTLLNGTSDIGEFELSSRELPIILDSFSTAKCKVSAPRINILGTSCINDFYADIRDTTDGLLKVTGTLATKLLNIFGSMQIDGTVNLAEDSRMALKRLEGNNSITINGQLASQGILRLDGSKSHARIINNGEIVSLSGEAFFLISSFVNGEHGRIRSAAASFELENRLENLGELQFEHFSISLPSRLVAVANSGFNPVSFYQRGIFGVSELATMNCNFESFGRTIISQLVFPHTAGLKVLAGQTHIGRVNGNVSILQSKDGAIARIDSLEGGAEFVESLRGRLQVGAITLAQKSVFTAKAGGSTSVGRVDAPNSFIFSHDSQIEMRGLGGSSTVFATGSSRFKVTDATRLDILTMEHSQSQVDQSTVNRAYLLGDGTGKFSSTTADSVTNRGEFLGVDTEITDLQNAGTATFAGETKTRSLSNHGEVTFQSGEHKVTRYSGESDQSKLKLDGEIEDYDGQVEGSIVLQDGDAKIRVEKLSGTGAIDARQQTYRAKVPTSFHMVGNVDFFLDYMPLVSEIPTHEGGDVRFHVDLSHDFINETDVDYGDAIFLMNLHGNRWENRSVLFGAGGLQVHNANIFGNTGGMISLEQFLDAQAGKIFNISRPIVRDNGRWVDDWSNWRARLKYYCPATYYSSNPNTGIIVGGDIILHSETDTLNRFSSISSMTGSFLATAGRKFENTVGSISAFGQSLSSITAETIVNSSLPAYLRQGGAHASGRSGWGWNRRTWHAYSYTAEWVTQSPGSTMLFGGDTTFIGHTENIGSSILSYGLFSGDVSSTSVLENTTRHGSLGTLVRGGDVHYQRPHIFVHADFEVE